MKWKSNKIYPNVFQSLVNNELEYIELAKELFKPYKILRQFSCDKWYDEEQLIDDYDKWHYLLETEETEDDDLEFFSNPLTYDKGINHKPSQKEYPVIVTYNADFSEPILYWQSIKELQEE